MINVSFEGFTLTWILLLMHDSSCDTLPALTSTKMIKYSKLTKVYIHELYHIVYLIMDFHGELGFVLVFK